MALVILPQFNIAAHFVDAPAGAHPERAAILGEPQQVTYVELQSLTNRVGNALLSLDVACGERVLMALPDSVEFVAGFFGAAKIGAVAVPVNPMTRAADYTYYAADCGARVAIVHEMVLPEFAGALESGVIEHLIVVGQGSSPVRCRAHVQAWPEWLRGQSDHLEAAMTSGADPAFFLYTSGSGGTPKGAVHQHKDMLVTAESFGKGVLGLRADDRTFSVSKLFFAYGLGNGMYFPLSVGASTIYNPDRPRPDKILDIVKRYRPTVFFSVPTIYAALLRAAEAGETADFSSVRMAVSAGEALPAEIFEQWRKRFGLEILDGIGSTELLHMFISNRAGTARPGTCGTEVPNYAARILDDKGQPVAQGEIGNLWVQGGSAFEGYWNKPELTARTIRDGWVLTGDKFFHDADGYYHYCGRSDDMMKVSGMWVSPGEVENALLGHPAIAEAAVVGETDQQGLTRPVAYVVLREGISRSRELPLTVREWVRERLPGYKCPQEVRLLKELPKTATGKIQRFRLRHDPSSG